MDGINTEHPVILLLSTVVFDGHLFSNHEMIIIHLIFLLDSSGCHIRCFPYKVPGCSAGGCYPDRHSTEWAFCQNSSFIITIKFLWKNCNVLNIY